MDRRSFIRTGSAGVLVAASGCGGGGSSPEAAGASTVPASATTAEAQALAATDALPPKARVIVVGGGMAGAAAAKYLRRWGGGIDVTLIDRNLKYTSNIMSNLVLTGQRSLSSLAYGYDTLKRRWGVKVLTDEVIALDPVNVSLRLAGGATLTADRIVLAPGVEFDAPAGNYDATLMPHAWQAGVQTTLLQQQLAAMRAGGTVVLTVPKAPYRCPPGPYERACLLADWLKTNKPGSKLIVLDANPDFVTEADNFSLAFYGLHANVIEYRTNVRIDSVDVSTMTLSTDGGLVHGDVINLIPVHRAGKLVQLAGLATANGGRFAPVDVLSYASTDAPRIHVLGDANSTTQPKSGHLANQEAKVCADAIARIVAGGQPDAAPVTSTACYSTITRSQATWLTALFQYDAATQTMVVPAAASGASSGWNSENYRDMGVWFQSLMSDTFA